MEITPLTIYLFYLVDTLKSISYPLLGLCGLLTVLSAFGWLLTHSDAWVSPRTVSMIVKTFKIASITGLCALVANIIIPSGKVMVAMYVVPKVVNNESVQQLPGEILDFIRSYLRENTIKQD